jgi:hypothetical protein
LRVILAGVMMTGGRSTFTRIVGTILMMAGVNRDAAGYVPALRAGDSFRRR